MIETMNEKMVTLDDMLWRGDAVEKRVAQNCHLRLLDNPNADILHPFRLAQMAQNEDERVVALLHDEIEDGYETITSLNDSGLVTPEQLIAIVLLTREKEEQTYAEYIELIARSKNPLAITVKYYDLFDHMHPCRVGNLTPSYLTSYLSAWGTIAQGLYFHS